MPDAVSLIDALTALRAASITVLPREATAKKAAAGKVWSGRRPTGQVWTLTKHGEDMYSFTV